MSVELLKTVGQVAGIGGLAIGALVLIFRDIIRKNIFPKLPAQSAYHLLRLIIIAAWSISAMGIAAYAYVKTLNGPSSVTTTGDCSPTIIGFEGPVQLSCNLSADQMRDNAESNLETLASELRILSTAQSGYLIPSLGAYVANPSEQTWAVARGHVARVKRRLDAAIDSAIAYDASLEHQLGPTLQSLHGTLNARAQLLAGLPEAPPDRDFVVEWASQYRQVLRQLAAELASLQEKIQANT